MKRILLLTTIFLGFLGVGFSQNVFDPSDPIIRYSSNAAYGSQQKPDTLQDGLHKWVSTSTNGISSGTGRFDASSYKAYFFRAYNEKIVFRLKFPKSYTNPDSVGKKYPLMLFMSGAGEVGCRSNNGIYNNEKQLAHGGKLFMDRVDNNQYDGFLLYPQLQSKDAGCWGEWGALPSVESNLIIMILDSLVKYARMDNDRVLVDGLSGGGAATWRMASNYPTRIAAAAPTSAASVPVTYSAFVHIPVWLATGAKDSNPSPEMAEYSYNLMNNLGGNIRWSLYPDLGHSSWYRHWEEPDFVPFMNAAHKANPLIFFNRSEFCPGDPISAKLGITPGFNSYEWEKDGEVIARRLNNGTATITAPSYVTNIASGGNEITVKAFGVYRVRFRRTASSEWSAWSPKPAVISPKPITQTPPIQISGAVSKVVPSLDGRNTVQLQLPPGFEDYQWVRTSDNVLVSTGQIYEAPVGTYKARYSEPFGCGTEYSPVFTVVNANGNPKPDDAKNLAVTALSQTSLKLDWSENPNATQNETGFEIFRATKEDGPYEFLYITQPDVISYTDTGLVPNTQYFYQVRAVSETGAAAPSNKASAKTEMDSQPPTAPYDLEYAGSGLTSVSLKWKGASDNTGIQRYDIYANGVKLYSTTNLSFVVANLDSLTSYSFTVKAIDKAGNESAPSNQVIGFTHRQGLNYKYYHGSYSNLPDFNSLTPEKQGITDTVNAGIGIRTRDDNFAMFWEGRIFIPANGTYTFETYSDDGSRFYIDVPYTGTNTEWLVNNDGAHGAQYRTGTKYLTQGYHDVVITFSEVSGDEVMDLYWSSDVGMERQRISKGFFAVGDVANVQTVNAPSSLAATPVSYNKINLTWTDNSDNETGFEVSRATSLNGDFIPLFTTGSNATAYSDSALSPDTRYYYRIRAIGSGGGSPYAAAYTEGNWRFNNNYNEAGNGSALSPSSTSFMTDHAEGSHAVEFSSNDYISFAGGNSAFPSQGGYSERTVALWIKPTATNNYRIVFEFGGNDNGLGLRFNSNALIAGIASGSSRHTASLNSFVNNSNWRSNQWNHVAVVYNVNTLKLYLNGVEVAANNSLPFLSVGNSSNASRIGRPSATNTSGTVFNTSSSVTGYTGGMDDLYIIRGALSADEIGSVMANTFKQSSATTLAAPAPPAAPSALSATALSTSSIRLSWSDNSSDEQKFEIWRASGDKSNNRLVATIDGGSGAQKTFTDTTLFANVTYFYRVRAMGPVASSGYSNEASGTTLNTKPVLEHIRDFTMRYSTTFSLPVKATDADGDQLVFSMHNLPTFATVEQVANGNINLVFSPNATRRGNYLITVYVSDGNNGHDTTRFGLIVNSNDVPVMSELENITLNEGQQTSIPISVTDKSGTAMTWYFEGMPSFVSFTDNHNGSGSLQISPSYADAGEYEITAFASDALGAWISRTFTVLVGDRNPTATVQFNFRASSQAGVVPTWNNVALTASAPYSFAHGPLIDTDGKLSPITLTLLTPRADLRALSSGPQSPNGVYPNDVMRELFRWNFYPGDAVTDTMQVEVAGLDINSTYDFVFYSGYPLYGDAGSVTKFRIGNQEAAVNYYLNTSMTDTIYGVSPNSSGKVIIRMIGDPNINFGGILNAMVIQSHYDDGSAPASPANLSVMVGQDNGVELTWTERAYNELGYLVYRSTNRNGGYSVLNEGATNRDSVSYVDATVASETEYYYYVAGWNAVGVGQSSDTVRITIGNNSPVINTPESVHVKTDAVLNFDFTVSDDPTQTLTVAIVDKPSFVSLQDLGNKNYRLVISPSADHVGATTLTIRATDNKGAVAEKELKAIVGDKNTRSVFVNFGVRSAAIPWNNWLGTKGSNNTINNLRDEANVLTPFTVTTASPWPNVSTLGHVTGNNSGVFPDSVLASGIYDISSTRTVNIGGLNNSMRYNIVLMGSQNEGTDAISIYASGSVRDTLNARYNTQQTGNLNGLTPTNGQISVSITRLNGISGNTLSMLNALVIEEYSPSLTVMNPLNLYAEPVDRNSIDLSWSDRASNEAVAGGYVLERATDSLFSQNLVSIDLPGNSSTYRNTGLTANTKYWFRLRARTAGGAFSDYSNRAKAVTPASIVSVNFNYDMPDAPFPWNNLFSSPTFSAEFPNLIDQSGNPSGLTLELTKIFNGEFTAGVTTGNNSGVVPDSVLASDYWLDKTQLSQFKLSGLNHSRRYRIGFIGSSSSPGWFKGDYTATYTINGRTVYLNSWMNRSKVVYIDNVVPDENGEVFLNFSTTEDAMYGFNAGLIIQGYVDGQPSSQEQSDFVVVENSSVAGNNDEISAQLAARLAATPEGRAYPNPFQDLINVDFNNSAASNDISMEVYDLSGRLRYRKNLGQLPQGGNTVQLMATDAGLKTGVYIVTISANGKPVQANKVFNTAH